MKRSLLYLRAAAMALVLAANAPPAGDEIFSSLEPVSDTELDEQRGGFTFGGMDIRLGAEIRTYLDGELALLTNVTWTDTASSKTEVLSAALTPADASVLQAGLLSTGGITMKVGDNTVYLANQGQTAVFHRTDGGLQNVLINTANGAEIAQEVDLDLDLSGYEAFNAGLAAQRVGDAIAGSIADATAGFAGN